MSGWFSSCDRRFAATWLFFPRLVFLIFVIGAPCAWAQIEPPTITTQPQNLTINPGYPGTLTVAASGSGTLSYRWFKNGAALADGGGLTGTTTATLSFAAAQAVDAGGYTVVVSNSGGSVTSATATVTVAIIYAPVITSATALSAQPSAPLTFTIVASNSPTAFGATGLPSGLVIDPVTGAITGTPSTQGIYAVVFSATNAIGTGIQNFTLTIEAELPSYADKVLVNSTTDGSIMAGRLSSPAGVAIDATGNAFVADAGNHTIAKLTSGGVLSIVAGQIGQGGSADGVGTAASFLNPGGVAVDADGNLYVADTGNHTIRKIAADGTVSTVAGLVGTAGSADGTGAAARFFSPQGITLDTSGTLYVADTSNHTIRTITAAGVVSTLAGSPGLAGTADGTGSAARFNRPNSVALDRTGSVYVADGGNNVVRKISRAGAVTTLTGIFNQPSGVAVDGTGNIFVSDTNNNALHEITAVGTLRKLALKPVYQLPNVPRTPASITYPNVGTPTAMTCDVAGNLYWLGRGIAPSFGLHRASPFFPVAIVTPPHDTSVLSGSTAQFSVAATGQPLDYAWYGPALQRASSDPRLVYLDSTSSSQTVQAQLAADTLYHYQTNAGTYGAIIYNIGSSATATARLSITPEPPVIVTPPASQTVVIGQSATFAVAVTSKLFLYPSYFAYAWKFNNTPIAGATGPAYTIPSVQASDAGNYAVTVTETSFAGTNSITSYPGVLTVTPPSSPHIAAQPQPLAVKAGGSATFTVTATGIPAPNYQWNLNGVAIPDATGATLTLSNAQLASAGSYTVTVTNLAGSITTEPAALDVITTRLVNLSARGSVDGAHTLIVGFVTNGSAPKQLLLRGIGPTLATFGVGDALSAPLLTLFDSRSIAIATNRGWGGTSALTNTFGQVGAFSLPPTSADTALLSSFATGLYSVQLSGLGGANGVGLAEIYDADSGSPASRLINLSARGFVGTGGNVLIAGFVIVGNHPAKILVRAIGPTLSSFAVNGALAGPQLTLFDSAGAIVATNTIWGGDTALDAAFTQVGAFSLPLSSRDSALLATLPPGTYTAHVSGVGGATGTALVEVYEVP